MGVKFETASQAGMPDSLQTPNKLNFAPRLNFAYKIGNGSRPLVLRGGFASAHDFHISALIADVICGGDVDAGSLVTEEYLMALERRHFCALLDHPKTQERIMGMLQSGKPVRN